MTDYEYNNGGDVVFAAIEYYNAHDIAHSIIQFMAF